MNNSSMIKGIEDFIQKLVDEKGLILPKRSARKTIQYEFSEEYNALRIMLIVRYCGKRGGIRSKALFSFCDFLLRFPLCLKYILDEFGIAEEFSDAELYSLDKKMIRHISSAWDPDYYNYLSYLWARGLIDYDFEDGFCVSLTSLGKKLLAGPLQDETEKWVRRCKHIREVVGAKSDDYILGLMREHFSFAVIDNG